MIKSVTPVLSILSCLILVSACDSNDVSSESPIVLDFAAKVNNTDFVCGDTYSGVGTNNNDYTVTDFRLYVHDVHIHDEASGVEYEVALSQDGVFQLDGLALLDFENGCNAGTTQTNTMIAGTVTTPQSVDLSNTEVCFTLGVPEDMNHTDASTAASPLNDVSMLWAWKIGRKYLRIDGVGDPAGTNLPFNIHLGAQGDCGTGAATVAPTQSCTVPNTVEVCVQNMNVNTDTIVIDPVNVLEASDISTTLGGTNNKHGCQSFANDDDCIEVMPRLGLDYNYGNGSSTSAYSGEQRLFSKQ
ncbi:MAG: metallo-mystery pair system four-Cys motif protein [endosymbiont of Galathealinum brachiosum]|uniref:Metallo-mystery pair system four-Cys motif protein n=1 Tax=endosymbiont of Galathealinum brachiosum TaxID=2200906 RepID=A0A370DMZ6_9GAMM|nr:MAG: metallo-mystery pair system four-Cys motif protein [endosymbiont of Galathealinum brachiosum]